MGLLAFMSPGPMELCIIAGVMLLLFGTRLPKIMRALGGSITEFKKGVEYGADLEDSIKAEVRDIERKVRE